MAARPLVPEGRAGRPSGPAAGFDLGRHYLDDVLRQLRKLKGLAERAIGQVDESDWFRAPDPESNPIAIVMKHLAGNMRSRWTDFLTTDGEKPDRGRDREFELEAADTAASIRERWETGWTGCLDTIGTLEPAGLGRTVRIRGEPHTVVEAIDRQLCHYAYHVGQIVLLARHFAGDDWRSLSIPKGMSEAYDVSKEGERYDVAAEEGAEP